MSSTYVSSTVHDNPRRTNLYVNFVQTIHYDHTPAHFSVPHLECVLIPFRLFSCVLPILYLPDDEALFMHRLRKSHILIINSIAEFNAHAKYSPDALPVKEIAFHTHTCA